MSRAAARVKGSLALRSVVALLMAFSAFPAVAAADVTTTACAAGDNTSTTYCPGLQGGNDDEPDLLNGFGLGGTVSFGVGAVAVLAGLYRRVTGADLRG